MNTQTQTRQQTGLINYISPASGNQWDILYALKKFSARAFQVLDLSDTTDVCRTMYGDSDHRIFLKVRTVDATFTASPIVELSGWVPIHYTGSGVLMYGWHCGDNDHDMLDPAVMDDEPLTLTIIDPGTGEHMYSVHLDQLLKDIDQEYWNARNFDNDDPLRYTGECQRQVLKILGEAAIRCL